MLWELEEFHGQFLCLNGPGGVSIEVTTVDVQNATHTCGHSLMRSIMELNWEGEPSPPLIIFTSVIRHQMKAEMTHEMRLGNAVWRLSYEDAVNLYKLFGRQDFLPEFGTKEYMAQFESGLLVPLG